MKKIRKKIENWVFDLFENSEKKEKAIERVALFMLGMVALYIAFMVIDAFINLN